ncbi:MAG: MBL fold metallo-hydrolase [Prochlorotrichaceae cyanobacterium]|jgi:glyoxylase-like metal-dependent hydrolase (beta-lactamase superfamily II)
MMSLKVDFFQGGYCTHPEKIVISDGNWSTQQFPSLFVLITHPQLGLILFDTGYSDRFFQETRDFPLNIYAFITPVYFQEEDSAVSQLQEKGIEPEAIKYVIISHFHGDHIGGLQDFPHAQFICFKSAYQAVKGLRGFNALRAGFLAGLVPEDFEKRTLFVENKNSIPLPSECAPFENGFDLLGDQSLIGIELPGHATGQLGLFFTDENHQSYFLIADACWLSRAYQEFIKPHPITSLIFSDQKEYVDTLSKIHQLHKANPNLKIIPTHCRTTWQNLKKDR